MAQAKRLTVLLGALRRKNSFCGGITDFGKRAEFALRFASCANLSPQADDVQVGGVIAFRRKNFFKVGVRFFYREL
jgi:hypothetical protein